MQDKKITDRCQVSVDVAFKSFKFNVALRPQRPLGLLGTGSPGRPPRLSHNSRALTFKSQEQRDTEQKEDK